MKRTRPLKLRDSLSKSSMFFSRLSSELLARQNGATVRKPCCIRLSTLSSGKSTTDLWRRTRLLLYYECVVCWGPWENSPCTWCRSTCCYFGCTRASPQAEGETDLNCHDFKLKNTSCTLFFSSNRHKHSGKIWAVRQTVQFLIISLLYFQGKTINKTNFCI